MTRSDTENSLQKAEEIVHDEVNEEEHPGNTTMSMLVS
jgi:hypothetical protein